MKNKITIDNYQIGSNSPPFIIAEMSGNHNQSLGRALKIVDAVSKSGAHALKLQTYTPDTMTLDIPRRDFFIDDPRSPWNGRSLFELYQEAHTPWEWHKAIFDRCRELGLICFSTPFDETAVDFLEKLNSPCYKIASFENTYLQLIRKVAATGKPTIISTGMASIAELDESVKAYRDAGGKDLILLKCTSSYPATPDSCNIRTIPHLKELFQCEVGLSDHTMGAGVSVASIVLGATVIEKHFTLERAAGGVDSAFSMEPNEMKTLVEECKRAWQALGNVKYGVTEEEKNSMVFRRSLYISKNIKAGEKLTKQNITIIRPGHGLKPKYFDSILGMRLKKDTSIGTPLNWNMIE